MAEREVSPAAVAAVARRLAVLPLPRLTEVRARTFVAGWDAWPCGDHVRVAIIVGADDDPETPLCQQTLTQCEEALREVHDWTVQRSRAPVMMIGGAGETAVLEVRRESWTARGG
jgi:hypothetical protein